jgi:glycosyltransferase involved in cell wall biosynthesis
MDVMIPLLGLTPHGGNRVLIQIANALVAAGHRCVLHASAGPEGHPFVIDGRVEIRRVGPGRAPKPLRWAWLLLSVGWRARQVDVVLANHFLTAFPARFASAAWRRNVFHFVQGMEYRAYRPTLSRVAKTLCRWAWGGSGVIAANPHVAQELALLGSSPEMTVDLGIAPVFLMTPRLPSGSEQTDVVCMLRHEHYKRLDRLLAVAAALQRDGRTVLGICQNASMASLYARQFTRVAQPDSDASLIHLYDSAKVFLLTSEYEGFALPPLECMARGVPAVLFPCRGPMVYAQDGVNCVVVGDVDAAVREVNALLDDPQRYERLSKAGLATAQRFDATPAIEKVVQHITGQF